MLMIIPLLKSSPHIHEYIKKLFGHILSSKNLCYTLQQQYPGHKLNPAVRRMYHHTLTISNTNFTRTRKKSDKSQCIRSSDSIY